MAASSSCKVCYGIEKSDIPNTYAENMSKIFQKWLRWYGKKSGKYELLKGDFLSEGFQEKINSATIIFANNFAFGPTLDHQLKQRFAELRDGTRIVSSKNFCSLNFRMTERNMSDIGAIMNVLNNKITGAVSWTDKPIPYYIQIIDRSKLARYFESKKSPKFTAKYCSDSSSESDSDTSSDFECSPFRVKGKKSNPTHALDIKSLDIKLHINSHSRSPLLHKSPVTIPIVSIEQAPQKPTNIRRRSPHSNRGSLFLPDESPKIALDIKSLDINVLSNSRSRSPLLHNRSPVTSPKVCIEQAPRKLTNIRNRSPFSNRGSPFLPDESSKIVHNSSSISFSNTYDRSPFLSRSPDSKFEDYIESPYSNKYESQGDLHIRSQSPISYKSDSKTKSSNPKDYRSRSPFTSNRNKNKNSKKSTTRRKSLEHDSPFRSPKCKSRKLEKIHDRPKSPKHKSRTVKRNLNKNHDNEVDYKISENHHSNYNLRHVNIKYASESESEFNDDIFEVKSKTSKREVHVKKPPKTWSKKNVDKKKYLNDFENFFQNVTSPKSLHDNKVHLRRNAKYDLELVDNGDNINRIRLKRFYKNMQSPITDSESDREVHLDEVTYKSIDDDISYLNEAEIPDDFAENVPENLYKKSPKYYAKSVMKKNSNTIELSESEKLLIKITSPHNVQNEYEVQVSPNKVQNEVQISPNNLQNAAPFIETRVNRMDLSECESPKSATEVLSPLYTSKLMIQGNMNKIRLIKKRRLPPVIKSSKTENQDDPFEVSPTKQNSKCVENINFDQPNKYEIKELKISPKNCDAKSDNSKIGAKRRKNKPKKKVRSPSPFDNVEKTFENVLTENKIPDKEVAFDPKMDFLSDNSIDYIQKPVFLSENSNLESSQSHCEDSNSNFEVNSKICTHENFENRISNLEKQEKSTCCRVTRRRSEDSNSNFEVNSKICTHENLENRIPNLENEEKSTCCRVTRRTNRVNVKEIVKTECRKPKKTVRRVKRKKVYNIEGLDLLHEKTMRSISVEEITKYERPPFGCIEEKLRDELRRKDEITNTPEINPEDITIKQYFEKDNSLEMSTNILRELSEFESSQKNGDSQNVREKNMDDSNFSKNDCNKHCDNIKNIENNEIVILNMNKIDSPNHEIVKFDSINDNVTSPKVSIEQAPQKPTNIRRRSPFLPDESPKIALDIKSRDINVQIDSHSRSPLLHNRSPVTSPKVSIEQGHQKTTNIRSRSPFSNRGSPFLSDESPKIGHNPSSISFGNIYDRSPFLSRSPVSKFEDCIESPFLSNSDKYESQGNLHGSLEVNVCKSMIEKKNYYIKKDLDYATQNECEILNNKNEDVKQNLSENDDRFYSDYNRGHTPKFDCESKFNTNKTENTAKCDVIQNEVSQNKNEPKNIQVKSTNNSNNNHSYVKTGDLSITSQSDMLQRLLNTYRNQFLQMVDRMRSPEYQKQVEAEISTEKTRNMLLSKKVSQLTLEIQSLLSNGTSLLRCHLHNLKIKPTPKHVLIAGKEIVHHNINLRDTANKLQADLFDLESEKDRLIEKRSEEILKCDEIDLNENLIYVQVILAQAKEMILKNRELKEKCCKLEEQLDTLEIHQGYILTEQIRDSTKL